jgi:tetratricopeptide (TPR) repeat protein
MRCFGLFVAGLLLALSLSGPAAADFASDREHCTSSTDVEPDVIIGACSRQIKSGRWKGHDLAICYANRGRAYLRKDEPDDAIANFNEAIRNNPKYTAAYFHRARAYTAKGDHHRAIGDYDRAIKLSPKDAALYNNRGNRYRRTGDPDRAIADYTVALQIKPKDPLYYQNRGLSHWDKGDLDRALADFNAALRHDPTYAAAYINRGAIHEEKGDLEGARADYNIVLALPASDGDADDVQGKARKALAALDAGQRSAKENAAPTEQSSASQADQPAAPVKLSSPGRRVALVIGNSAYGAVSALPNPRRDADALAAALRRTGFASVTVRYDLGRDQLVQALRAFEEEVEAADWAMIYFAGHGIEINGINYLVPVDARLKADRDVQDEAVPLDRVLSSIENAKKLRLVVLDACRDNPFVAQMRRSTASRSIGRGLARIEPEGGTLVAYAAKHGQIALDGTSQNSPLVSALVKRLATPNLQINKLFRLVRDDVLAATGKRQEPFVYGSLPGEDFYFVQR